ncbi:MAG: LytTR family DNA-binding domain-containing protein [Bacteroidales bacterium]|nr:LytTR family DNA-binding domain-containing protein [Bacteroidales bacterium]
MKAVIIEDENFAAQALQNLIQEIDPSIEIVAVLQSIEESVEWFKFSNNPAPDLVFMDIHLADGPSFAIFDEVKIPCPIIFTTAYDEYALKAFEVNSIDYLLKPISRENLERALHKYKNLTANPDNHVELINTLVANLKKGGRDYKSYFLVPEKDKLIPLATADIAYIYIDVKVVRAVTFSNKTYYLDQTLDELASLLNPDDFFRANRQYIISRKAVKDLSIWFGGKMIVNLILSVPERITVSKLRAKNIKEWIST